jgi:hypothetical protein
MNPTTGLPANEQVEPPEFRKSMTCMEVPAAPNVCPNEMFMALALHARTVDVLAPAVAQTISPTDKSRKTDAVRLAARAIDLLDIRPFHTMNVPVAGKVTQCESFGTAVDGTDGGGFLEAMSPVSILPQSCDPARVGESILSMEEAVRFGSRRLSHANSCVSPALTLP